MTNTILLVEDDLLDRKFIAKALLDADSSLIIETASDGQDALDRLRGDLAPDLVIFDLSMPGMDGQAFLEILKSDIRTKAIPAIVLSTSSDPYDVKACYDNFVNAYLVKPHKLADYTKLATRMIDFWFGEARRAPIVVNA